MVIELQGCLLRTRTLQRCQGKRQKFRWPSLSLVLLLLRFDYFFSRDFFSLTAVPLETIHLLMCFRSGSGGGSGGISNRLA